MSVISNAFVPSVGNVGRDRRFIGRCSGTVLYLCSGITTLVKCSSNSMGVYMYPPFDQGWCASSHPSPTYLIRICSSSIRLKYRKQMMRKYTHEERKTQIMSAEGPWRHRRMKEVALPRSALRTQGQPLLLAESIPLTPLGQQSFCRVRNI